MRGKIGRLVALAAGWMLAGSAAACSCSGAPLDDEAARRAAEVFVFQLTEAKVVSDPPLVPTMVGSVRVVAHVRGRSKAREVTYQAGWCCGTRMEIGRYYVAFLDEAGARFTGNLENLVPLPYVGDAGDTSAIEAVLAGERSLLDAFPQGEMHTVPAPPPPPCPRDREGAPR